MEDDYLVIGGIPPERGRWLVYGSLLSLRRVMLAGDVNDWSDRALARFYAQAWALTHFLNVGHHQGHPPRHTQIGTYLALLNRDVPPDEACERAFGTTFEGIERDFVRYVGEGRIPQFGLPRERLSTRRASARHRSASTTRAICSAISRSPWVRLAGRGGALAASRAAGGPAARRRTRRARAGA